MATTTHYFVTAKFKTGRLQRELFEKFTPKATITSHIGEVFHIDSNGELERRESTTSAADAKSNVAVGDYIIAQSDISINKGHIPVENRDYRYSDAVAMTDSTPKNLAVFKVINLDDLILDTGSYTTT